MNKSYKIKGIVKEVIWKDLIGYSGIYKINNFGDILSLKRKRKTGGILKERILKQSLSQNGYAFVILYKDGKKHPQRIHRLVAQNFIGEPTDGLVVHHKDHNKLNNHVDNLAYVSKQHNTQQYYKTIGKSTGVVPYYEIPEIIQRVKNGEQCYHIADEYNVTRNDIAVLCKIIKLTGEELTIKE